MQIIFLILITIVALWVFYDAKSSGYNLFIAYLWTFGVLFFPLFVLPVYFLQKVFRLKIFINKKNKETNMVLCSKCGKENEIINKICLFCKNELVL